MKVLITGTSAQHYSSAASQRNLTYAGMLASAAKELGCEIVQVEADASWTLDELAEYDKVFVGLTSPLSVSANGTYGAFNAVSLLYEDPRLALFIDAPEPGKIFAGLRAVQRDEKQLFKPFYSRRSGYWASMRDEKQRLRIVDAALRLSTGKWPKTLWPTLPWYRDTANIVGVKDATKRSLVGLSFDSLYIRQPGVEALQRERTRAWGIDLTSTRWARSIAHTLGEPHSGIKDRKHMSGVELEQKIGSLLGVILTIHDDKRPWWSPLFVKSLNVGTPIVTEWKYSSEAGPSWAVLAARIENMSRLDAYELSVHQSREYLDKIPTREEALETLRQVIDKHD
jgi:hypothetical protein